MAFNFKQQSFKPVYANNPSYQRQRMEILQLLQKDPETAIGYAIGSAIGNHYWGKKRAKSAAEAVNATEPVSSGLGSTDFNQANAALDQMGAAPTATYNMSVLDAFNNAPAGNVMYSPNITTPQQRGQAPVTPDNAGLLGGLKDPQEMYQDMERQTTFNPGNTGFFTNGVRNMSNVIGGKQGNVRTVLTGENGAPLGATQIAERGAAVASGQPFNAQQRMNAAVQYLMNKKGYSPEDAAYILNPYMEQWQQRQDTENRQLADNLMQQLGGGSLSDADYKQKLIQLANLGDYGRNAANIYGRDLVSGQDKWRAQQQQAAANQRFAQQQALTAQRAAAQQNNIALRGQLNGRQRANTAANSGYSNADASWAAKRFDELENKLRTQQENGEQIGLTAAEQEDYNTASRINELVRQDRNRRIGAGQPTAAGNRPYESTGREFDPNNYNDQAAALYNLIRLNNGVLDDKVAGDFRELIGLDRGNVNPDEMTNKVIEHMRAYRQTAPAQNRRNMGGAF